METPSVGASDERWERWALNEVPCVYHKCRVWCGLFVQCIDHKDYLKNPHEVAQKVWNSIHSAANGAVMRTAVLGIPRFNNLSDVSESAVRICKATHYDPRY